MNCFPHWVLAIELLMGCQAIDLLYPLTSTEPLQAVHDFVRETIPWDFFLNNDECMIKINGESSSFWLKNMGQRSIHGSWYWKNDMSDSIGCCKSIATWKRKRNEDYSAKFDFRSGNWWCLILRRTSISLNQMTIHTSKIQKPISTSSERLSGSLPSTLFLSCKLFFYEIERHTYAYKRRTEKSILAVARTMCSSRTYNTITSVVEISHPSPQQSFLFMRDCLHCNGLDLDLNKSTGQIFGRGICQSIFCLWVYHVLIIWSR